MISCHRLMGRSSLGLLAVLLSASPELRADLPHAGAATAPTPSATFPESAMAATLDVIRTDEATQCPERAELMAAASGAQTPRSSATHAYRVTFERTPSGYRAQIVDETTGRRRELQDLAAQCAPLGRAVALALATMWATEQLEPPAPALRPASSADSFAPVTRPTSTTRWLLLAGGGAAVGLIAPVAGTIVADSAFERGAFSWALGGLWIPSQRSAVGPGTVDVELLAASIRGCAAAFQPVRLGLCARILAGELLAQSQGYDSDGQQTRPWIAVGVEPFAEGRLFSRLRYRISASAIGPVRTQDFSVQNVGKAYSPPPLGALVTLALQLVGP